jgi:hypothetical protein
MNAFANSSNHIRGLRMDTSNLFRADRLFEQIFDQSRINLDTRTHGC